MSMGDDRRIGAMELTTEIPQSYILHAWKRSDLIAQLATEIQAGLLAHDGNDVGWWDADTLVGYAAKILDAAERHEKAAKEAR